jgi:hypothetical protein
MPSVTDKTITTLQDNDLVQVIQTNGGGTECFISAVNLQDYVLESLDESKLVTTDNTATLTNKTLSGFNSTVTAITTLATADVTLSAAQAAAVIITIGTAHATNAVIAPATAGKTYLVINNDGATDAVFKAVGSSSPISITKATASWVYSNGTDYVKVTIE